MTTQNEILDTAKDKMQKSIASLRQELASIRAGRANASLLNGVTAEYYGAPTPLNQIASITVPEARVIMVTPYDKSALDDINPANDGDNIRLVVPQLTEERRKEISKKVKAAGEQGKVAIRNVRREAMDAVKKGNKNDDFTDDETHALEDKVQKLTDSQIKDLDDVIAAKEKEVLNG